MEEEGESRHARPAGPGACAAHLECDQRAARAEERRERRRLGAERVARHLEGDERAVVRERAREVIEFLEITHLENELAGNLSGGQKKLLELGRTMMVDAKIVFLDEVGAGVNRTLLKTIGS